MFQRKISENTVKISQYGHQRDIARGTYYKDVNISSSLGKIWSLATMGPTEMFVTIWCLYCGSKIIRIFGNQRNALSTDISL